MRITDSLQVGLYLPCASNRYPTLETISAAAIASKTIAQIGIRPPCV